MVDDRVILEDFGAIASHWASCLYGCVEAICKYQFHTPSFADCEYDHTFYYDRSRSGIQCDAAGDLDLKFRGVPAKAGSTERRIRELHGIDFRDRHVFSTGEFESFALQTLRRRRALLVIFDWFYVAGRREYQRIHAPGHAMCLVGLEAGGPVHLVDQYYGRLKIPREVFADFIRFSAEDGREGVKITEFDRPDTFNPPSSRRLIDLRRDIEFFLENLRSTDSSRGLAALQAFRDEIHAFSERAAPTVFFVPGMWQIGMQRAHFAEALRVISNFHPEFSSAERDELLRGLAVLHRYWFDLNFKAEAALMTNRPDLLAKAMAGLDTIIDHEREMPSRLEAVLRTLT